MLYSSNEVKEREIFNKFVREKKGGSFATVRDDIKTEDIFEEHEDEDEQLRITPETEEQHDSAHRIINKQHFTMIW